MEPVLLRLRRIFLVLGIILGVIGALFIGASLFFDDNVSNLTEVSAESSDCEADAGCGPVRFAVDRSPRLSAPISATSQLESAVTTPQQSKSDQAKATDLVDVPTATPISPTLTPPRRLVPPTPGPSTPTGTPTVTSAQELVVSDSYTSTAQVHARSENEAGAQSEVSAPQCPTSSEASFDLIPILGRIEHPDLAHGDLNLALRGYQVVSEPLMLLKYEGDSAPDPPQLSGLFQPNRGPIFKAVYQINGWVWNASQCGGQVHGCPGSLIDDWEATMVALPTRPGEPLSIPERRSDIYPGGFRALVLYAEELQITLGYTRHDSVSDGYTVHVQGVCVDPNLLALYRAQNDAGGWRASGRLPALRTDQTLGAALGDQINVAIRDRGSFMDPRSAKDWWQGY